ncbi:MAG TPA: peptide deformylase, partial [Nitrospiria bacterium]|nr:peptide deformylase [Nitrospiria bacterium]
MAVLKILQYPHPLLKSRSKQVHTIDGRINRIIQDLLDTLHASPGVALAAPQIGESYRIIVCDVSRKIKEHHHGQIILINPIIQRREGKNIFREGCLSVPDYTGNVSRAERVWVEGLSPQGLRVNLNAAGFEALALQHEMDHLEGILFLDRIASLSTDLF